MARAGGLEPPTGGFKDRCSPVELRPNGSGPPGPSRTDMPIGPRLLRPLRLPVPPRGVCSGCPGGGVEPPGSRPRGMRGNVHGLRTERAVNRGGSRRDWCRRKQPVRRQHRLKRPPGTADARVVAPEAFAEFLVAMNDAVASLHARLRRETLPAFAHGRESCIRAGVSSWFSLQDMHALGGDRSESNRHQRTHNPWLCH